MAKIAKTTYDVPLDLYMNPLSSIRAEVQALIDKYGEDAKVTNSGDYPELYITYPYEETPEEEATRLAAEAKTQENTLRYQLQQYEALKKKFEGQ